MIASKNAQCQNNVIEGTNKFSIQNYKHSLGYSNFFSIQSCSCWIQLLTSTKCSFKLTEIEIVFAFIYPLVWLSSIKNKTQWLYITLSFENKTETKNNKSWCTTLIAIKMSMLHKKQNRGGKNIGRLHATCHTNNEIDYNTQALQTGTEVVYNYM